MRRGPFLLLLLLLAPAALAGEEDSLQQWQSAVEKIVSGIVLGPFRNDFGPPYIAQRTRSGALNAQVSRFRAKVAMHMVESVETQLYVCPLEHMSGSAVAQVVVEELRAHNFTTASWLDGPNLKCPGRTGYLYVEVPPPRDE